MSRVTDPDLIDQIRAAVEAHDLEQDDVPSGLREDLLDAVVARLPDVPELLTADRAGEVAFSALHAVAEFGSGARSQDLAALRGMMEDREAELERVRRELAARRRSRPDAREMGGRELIAELRRRAWRRRRRAGTQT
jgi:hypothetical protein